MPIRRSRPSSPTRGSRRDHRPSGPRAAAAALRPVARGPRSAPRRRPPRPRGRGAVHAPGAAFEAVQRAENVVVVTPTASGKTLCYNLPVLDAVAKDEAARALYLFPTKALAQDQLVELRALAGAAELGLKTHTYDGDTPANVRRVVRAAGHIVVTNPDMLHAAILPHHTKWFKLFENLQFVVIDELHTYRGLFGSHVANVIRRLRRICHHYGSDPDLHLRQRHHRQPARAGRARAGGPGRADRRQRRAVRPQAHPRHQPAGRQRAARHPRLGAPHRAAPGGAADRWRRADDRLRALAHGGRGADDLPARDVRAAARPSAHDPRLPRRLPAERAARDRARPARRPRARRGRHQRARARDRHRRPRRRDQHRLPGHDRQHLAADGPRRPPDGHEPVGADLLVGADRPVPRRPSRVPVRELAGARAGQPGQPARAPQPPARLQLRAARSPPQSASGSRRRRPCSTSSRRTAASGAPTTTATTGATRTSRPATSACAAARRRTS